MRYLRVRQKVEANVDQIDRIRTGRTTAVLPYWWKPLFSNALPCNITQIREFEFCCSRGTDRHDRPKCQQLDTQITILAENGEQQNVEMFINDWIDVQDDRYRFLVIDDIGQIVIKTHEMVCSEYVLPHCGHSSLK